MTDLKCVMYDSDSYFPNPTPLSSRHSAFPLSSPLYNSGREGLELHRAPLTALHRELLDGRKTRCFGSEKNHRYM